MKPTTTVPEIEVTFKSGVVRSEALKIDSYFTAYDVFRDHWDMSKIDLREEVKVIYLNREGYLIGIYDLSFGCGKGCAVDIPLLFAIALKIRAHSLIMCHNHPSGNLTPSHADHCLADNLVAAGKLIGVVVADSIIISRDGYISMNQEGEL